MIEKPGKMSKSNLISNTERSRARYKAVLDLAEEMKTDTRKEDRLRKQECIACFYSSQIGGCAITNRDCMCCGENQIYGSTATDKLCLRCATEHNLCRHCGGDINMNTRRRSWPNDTRPPTSGG